MHFACMHYSEEGGNSIDLLFAEYPESLAQKDLFMRLPVDYAIRSWSIMKTGVFTQAKKLI